MSGRLLVLAAMLAAATACDSGSHYVGVGDVMSIDPVEHQVFIRHDQIVGLAEAGTTRFAVPSDEVRAALKPGVRLRFEVQRTGAELTITKAAPLAEGNPGIHDHTPHHGGVVAMAGMLHLEAKASADGLVQLYLTDIWRRPITLDGVSGTATFDLPDGKRSRPLAVNGDALEARGPALTQPMVNVAFAVQRGSEPVELSFLLPLARGDSGAAGIPVAGCVAPAQLRPGAAGVPPATAAASAAPRCVLEFVKPVVAVAASPNASTLLVAQVDLGISAFRLPAGAFVLGFAPPPPIAIPVAEPPHPEAPNAVQVRPDGREAVVAMENRLIIYAMDSGQVVRAFPGPGGIVRAVAWTARGDALLVSTFYNAAAFLVDAADGRIQRRLPIEREGAAVACSSDGETAAVGSETGALALFELGAATPPRMLRGARGPVRAVAFAGDRVVAACNDGVLRVWDRASGALQLERPLARTLRQMAVDGERGIAAAAGIDNAIHITALSDDAVVETRVWHSAQILSLTWAGSTLVSGDAEGRVALW